MKRFLLCAIALCVACTTAFAQTKWKEDDYEDMDKLNTELIRMKRQMDKMMKTIVSHPDFDESGMFAPGPDVRVDVSEDAKNVIVKADLPGMDKDKIDITLEKGRILTISGTREVVREEATPGAVRQERMSGSFRRVVTLPAECRDTGINASYRSGVLELVIPKMEEQEQEKVTIKVP